MKCPFCSPKQYHFAEQRHVLQSKSNLLFKLEYEPIRDTISVYLLGLMLIEGPDFKVNYDKKTLRLKNEKEMKYSAGDKIIIRYGHK